MIAERFILEDDRNLQRLEMDSSFFMIFLGDYGDRGANSIEVYYTILKLKIAFPRQVILLRGNHHARRMEI